MWVENLVLEELCSVF